MGHIGKEDGKQLRELFNTFENEVKMIYFTQQHECPYCKLTRELLAEVAELGDKISLEVHDFVKDKQLAEQYRIDKIPATILLGDRDDGIRFYGVPAGYEFTTLIEDLSDVARRDPRLEEKVTQRLAKLDRSLHLQVMVSPTCPVCPMAVRTAHRFAMASELIRADMVESSEFPHLVVKYQVQGVPHTVVNERFSLVGGYPELEMADQLLKFIEMEKNPVKQGS